ICVPAAGEALLLSRCETHHHDRGGLTHDHRHTRQRPPAGDQSPRATCTGRPHRGTGTRPRLRVGRHPPHQHHSRQPRATHQTPPGRNLLLVPARLHTLHRTRRLPAPPHPRPHLRPLQDR